MRATNAALRRSSLRSRPGVWVWALVAILLALYLAVVLNSRPRVGGDRLRLDQLFTLANSGGLLDARILDQDQFVTGRYRRSDGSVGRYNVPLPSGNGHANVVDLLLNNGIETRVDPQFSKQLIEPATVILPALLVIIVFAYGTVSYRQGSGLFGVRSGARRFGSGATTPTTFAAVAGQDTAITELREITEFLRSPERFRALGARVPKGVLLFGPPGCGKTLLARAVAGESGASFFSISGSDFVEMYVGVGAARVRDLFAEARTQAPAIVFIDELDSVGGHRTAASPSGREQDQTLNQILVEMDGFDANDGVMVMAATNRPDMLDPALVRPGRFDRRIHLSLPHRADRQAILALHAGAVRLDDDADLDAIAAVTQGYSGAELFNLVNESALLAGRGGRDRVNTADLWEGFARVRSGAARAVALGPEDRLMIAYHEMAHALVGRSLPGARSPQFVSLLARGHTLGTTWEADDLDRVVHTRSGLIDQMAGALAGRVAERMVFGEQASTSAEDLFRVTSIARRMVCELGMGESLRARAYPEGGETEPGGPMSSDTLTRAIEAEIDHLVAEAEARAVGVLEGCRPVLDAGARILAAQESLSATEIDDLIDGQVTVS